MPHPVYAMLGIKPSVSRRLGKHAAAPYSRFEVSFQIGEGKSFNFIFQDYFGYFLATEYVFEDLPFPFCPEYCHCDNTKFQFMDM